MAGKNATAVPRPLKIQLDICTKENAVALKALNLPYQKTKTIRADDPL